MMELNSLPGIDSSTVDEVVIGAMELLVEGETCSISSGTLANTDDITVAVYCDANQQSAVVLRCSYALALNLTGKMLEMGAEEIEPSDILDATGELVNVIAGNLRGLITSPGAMTAPFVVEQNIYAGMQAGAVNTYCVAGRGMQVLRI